MYINKNKKTVVIAILFLSGIVGIIVGIEKLPRMNGSFDPSFDVGVVSTSDAEERTSIFYYSSKGEEVCEQIGLRYAAFGYLEDEPAVSNKHLYAAPEGLQGRSDGRRIVDLDLTNGSIEEHIIPEILSGPSSISYCKGRIALCNNLNGKSNVGVYDLKTEKTIIHTFDNDKEGCVMDVLLTEKAVVCNGTGNGEDKNFLYVLDANTLEVIKHFETKSAPMHFVRENENVYFSESRAENQFHSYISILDAKKYNLYEWKMEAENDILSFMPIRNFRVVVDSEPQDEGSSKIITLGQENNRIDSLTIEKTLMQAIRKNNYLYALGRSADNKGTVFKIHISDSGQLKLKQSFPVKSKSPKLPPSYIFVNK